MRKGDAPEVLYDRAQVMSFGSLTALVGLDVLPPNSVYMR